MVVFAELPRTAIGAHVISADGKIWKSGSDDQSSWHGLVDEWRNGIATIAVTHKPDPVGVESGAASAIPIGVPQRVSVSFRES